MSYSVEFTPRARKQLLSLEAQIKKRVGAAVDALSENPRPAGHKKLSGPDAFYRIRVGAFRIVYEIHDSKLVILVVIIEHRGEVYRVLRARR